MSSCIVKEEGVWRSGTRQEFRLVTLAESLDDFRYRVHPQIHIRRHTSFDVSRIRVSRVTSQRLSRQVNGPAVLCPGIRYRQFILIDGHSDDTFRRFYFPRIALALPCAEWFFRTGDAKQRYAAESIGPGFHFKVWFVSLRVGLAQSALVIGWQVLVSSRSDFGFAGETG